MPPARSTAAPIVIGGIAVTVAAESVIVVGGPRVIGTAGLVLALLASAAWAFVASDARVERHVWLVVGGIGLAFAIALSVPPRNSHDLWSYVMYGRTVSVHHASPYVHPPSDFQHDAFAGRVASGWRNAKSVYGPAFTGVSAALTRLAGDSPLRARLLFQGLSALGIAGALALLWRTTRSVRALAFAGLHPAVVIAVVNGGHNDALVGLAVIGGVVLASRRRWFGAGFVLGLGILVKASAGLALPALAIWAVRRSRRGALQLVVATAATTAVVYAAAGTAAIRAVGGAGNGNTRASVWDPISSLLHPSTTLMLVLVLLFVAVAAWSRGTASRPETASLATIGAYLIGGVYVLPWYAAWVLPIAALERRTRLAALVAAHAAFLVAIYEYELPAHPTIAGAPAAIRSVLIQLGAWSALAVLVALLVRARSQRSQHSNADTQGGTAESARKLAGRHPAVVGDATEQVGRVGTGRREEPSRRVLSSESASE